MACLSVACVYGEGMESLSFVPGKAEWESASPMRPWAVRFEDEGIAGYLYACDRSLGPGEQGILDAMLLYNVAALTAGETEQAGAEPGLEAGQRLAAVEWSRDGLRAVFYLDGTAQALVDFGKRTSCCRSNFPNFLPESGERWRGSSHAWDAAAVEEFEAGLYR